MSYTDPLDGFCGISLRYGGLWRGSEDFDEAYSVADNQFCSCGILQSSNFFLHCPVHRFNSYWGQDMAGVFGFGRRFQNMDMSRWSRDFQLRHETMSDQVSHYTLSSRGQNPYRQRAGSDSNTLRAVGWGRDALFGMRHQFPQGTAWELTEPVYDAEAGIFDLTERARAI